MIGLGLGHKLALILPCVVVSVLSFGICSFSASLLGVVISLQTFRTLFIIVFLSVTIY
jgi:hypothetical protein